VHRLPVLVRLPQAVKAQPVKATSKLGEADRQRNRHIHTDREDDTDRGRQRE
jgi:hypothetical protein